MSSGQGSGRQSHIQACAYDDKLMTPSLCYVLGVLGTYGDARGYCFPAQETLAKRIGVTRQYVQKALAQLEALGYIISVRRRRDNDPGESTKIYRLVLDFDLPLDRYRLPPPPESPHQPQSRSAATPATNQVAPPATSEVAPPATHLVAQNVPYERPMLTTLPSNGVQGRPVAAATPRECGYPFLESEPLYLAACGFLTKPGTRAEIGRWARAIADLREAGATKEQVTKAVRNFRTMFPRARLTITALSNNWALLLQGDTPYGANRQDSAADRAAAEQERERQERERERLTRWAIEQLDQTLDHAAADHASRLPREV